MHISNNSSATSNIDSDYSYNSSFHVTDSTTGSTTDSARSVHVHARGNTRYLSFGCLNTCGLKNRIKYPEYIDLINQYDFFGVTETKLDCFDTIELAGYTFLHQHRRQKFLRKSGGIGIFYKNEFRNYVSAVEHDSDYVFWIRLDKTLTKTDEDVFYGVTYMPPADSRFRTNDELDQFELEITDMCITHKYVYLLGDFNARSGLNDDFLPADDEFARMFEYDDTMINHFNKSSCLPDFGLSIKRVNKDSLVNNDGNFLLDICKSNNIFILNGRCGHDRDLGSFTFKNISTIDYSLSSFEGLKYISDFSVQDLDPLFSDGHSLIVTVYNFGMSKHQPNKTERPIPGKQFIWRENNKNNFVQNIDLTHVNSILDELNKAASQPSVDEAFINQIALEISSIFQKSASQTCNMKPKVQNYSNNKSDKQWFGFRCRNARVKYMSARKRFNKRPTQVNKEELHAASKKYKNTLNFHINKHNFQLQNKLRQLHSSRPKEFWRLLNRLDSKSTDEKIKIEELYEYSKNLNSNELHEDDDIQINLQNNDEILNSQITDDEIKKCVNKLHNNKSPSEDMIINEYIKSTIEIMLPIYRSYFNIILDSGNIPETWLKGIICPIYKRSGSPTSPENYRPITLVSCLSKLFTSIISTRLNTFLETFEIMNENQAGFRANYSTTDHIFALHALIEILKARKTKLFCSFIDFRKAFDSVWRVGLWQKLLQCGINGKLMQVIHNMYKNIKSCVKFANQTSDCFEIYNGVRQGENLSPVLFCMFLNDLNEFLEDHGCSGLNFEVQHGDILTFLKLLTLLYADDTVIFATDPATF